jgi:adenylosuccinate synthase
MTVVIAVGAQWGDEGKGKVVDLFTEGADMVVRYGGGANAGHTLVIDGVKLVTHLIPSGVLHPGKRCVLGDGMVIDPQTLIDELAECNGRGLLSRGELLVGRGAHVIFPYHRMLESVREQGAKAIGTTRRGIGPAYEAKAARRGIRMRDLLCRSRLHELVEENVAELRSIFSHDQSNQISSAMMEKMVDDACRAGETLAPHMGEAGEVVAKAIAAKRNVLFEGAQGALLDIDHGTYPYVTSSSTIAAGACQSLGIGPTAIDRVIGIAKAYLTRVGAGPFPTEMSEAEDAEWRDAGAEFGATTGRARRCGWLDLPALRLAVRLNGMTSLALTKLDILAGRKSLRLCTAYRLDGEVVETMPTAAEDVARAEPIFEDLPTWQSRDHEAKNINELSSEARTYINRVAEAVGIPVSLISIGPDRAQSIVVSDPFSPL